MKRLILTFIAVWLISNGFPKVARAVGINGEGGANATYGEAYIRSLPNGQGHGNYTPGQTVSGTWAAFHCTGRGTAPCATDLTPQEATKIGEGTYSVTVPAVNQRVYVGRHNYSSQQCGRIQYDFGTYGDGTIGGWVYDFGNDCTSQPPAPTSGTQNSCQQWLPVNTQFRRHTGNDTPWVSGADLGTLRVGEVIDVNCFAQNGNALLPDADIHVGSPVGELIRGGAELRNYRLDHVGNYSFTCRSRTLEPVCEDRDQVSVQRVQPTVTPTPTPRPPVGGPIHEAVCKQLTVVSGDGALAPATVEVSTEATDNMGEIRKYRYHWGDGAVNDLGQKAEHKYETGGSYDLWVEVLDSRGNWRTSDACRKSIQLKTPFFSSHRSYCSEVVIVSGNDRQAPSEVVFEVNGYDNKGAIQDYKLDFGDGTTEQNSEGNFKRNYASAGTYNVKGYVKDSKGNWVGGEASCVQSVRMLTKPVTKQPDTGAPLVALGLTGLSGLGSMGLWGVRKLLINDLS